MADGNNLKDRFPERTFNSLILGIGELAAQVSDGAGKVTSAIKETLEDVSSQILDRVTKAAEDEARTRVNQVNHETNEVDVETTDKILNGAMNNSRFDIKVSLAEGILNGLFCGSLITVNIHNYAAPQPPASSEEAKTEES